MNQYLITRRRFLKGSAVAAAGVAAVSRFGPSVFAQSTGGVSLIVDPADKIAGSVPPQWALTQLQGALEMQGMTVHRISSITQAPAGYLVVASSGSGSLTGQIGAGVPPPPESITLMTGSLEGRPAILVSGSDARGMVYAILELTDRVLLYNSVATALTIPAPIVEQTRTKTRSVCKTFVSEQHDKNWYWDKAYWDEYLTMLAAERFNRFNLAFGMGNDFGDPTEPECSDGYFVFMYPFLVSIRGVTAEGLSDSERQKNLETLQYISAGCGKRALDFQIGCWCQSKIVESDNYRIQNLSGSNAGSEHAAYGRDALAEILTACPEITGLTFRVHKESGIPEGNNSYWRTLFSAVTPFVNAGRPIEIDMHGKNFLQEHLDAALDAKAHPVISPKKVGEHQGLPYHHLSVRPQDIQQNSGAPTALEGKSTRHGYSNFLQEGRKWGVLHRMWPGTTRHLLWADPVYAAGYGRAAYFCGSQGIEWYEPLCFKGRSGTGDESERNSYSDGSLTPARDFHKFLYTYRVWGRNMYNPDSDPETWRRYLVQKFGSAARDVEDALGNASRILNLVTTCHGASVSCLDYWPEVYHSFNIVDGMPKHIDNPNPLRVASSFDPQLFPTIDDYAEALLDGREYDMGSYFPIEFSQWVEDFANTALSKIVAARSTVPNSQDPEFRRVDIDVHIQAGIGLFFGQKWRAAVLYSIYRKTNDPNAKTEAIKLYESAINDWKRYCADIGSVYKTLYYGRTSGHWSDRIEGFNADLQAMKNKTYNTVESFTTHPGPADAAIAKVLGRPVRPEAGASHAQPAIFSKGNALSLSLTTDESTQSARLYYRHVNQAESWQSRDMSKSGNQFAASIPGDYTDSDFPLQYYFTLKKGDNLSVIFPGFNETLSNQPYFHVRSVAGESVGATAYRAAHLPAALSKVSFTQKAGVLEVHFTLSRAAQVRVRLHTLSGKLVASLRDNPRTLGRNVMRLNMKAMHLSHGNYVMQITAGGEQISKKVSFLK